MLARTALSAAVTVALVSAPATLGVPAFGSATASGITAPGPSESLPAPSAAETQDPALQPTETPHADPSPTDEPDDEETHEAEDDATLPDGTFTVRKAKSVDTFALYHEGSDTPFRPDRPRSSANGASDGQGDDRDLVIVPLPDPDSGADRDFVLKERTGALNLVTDEGDVPFRPGENGEGDRTFEFDVTGGRVGDVSETTPNNEPSPEPTHEPSDSPSPTDNPSEGPPEPEPSPTAPVPTPDPTEAPDPSPTDPDEGDDRDDEDSDDGDGADDEGSGDDGADSGERDDGGLTEDPSTGNGSDDGTRDDPREAAPSGDEDWVPTGPQRPDYSDPVPQPPGAGEDDAITPDGEPSTQPADGGYGDDGASDDVATDSASEDGSGEGLPWQIGVVVAIGAAAVGFILFVAGRRRKD